MKKLLVLIALMVTVYSAWDGKTPDIPGISAESMKKLREMLTPRPANKEAFKQVMEKWKSTLSATEKAAADAHREKMIKLKEQLAKRAS
ncbi:hypothetical protein RB195_012994 [Necator americanus]|uniref:Uncharacterized protein n=2 Tax=Necator americanus TaxID=51031 RepID=A0ABR1DTG6_NECAM|nr:hypothetical protein NECAME_02987 [Necator americanus]ETN78028.1 hypothetical protein NECAME_02987 [Necator americanus]